MKLTWGTPKLPSYGTALWKVGSVYTCTCSSILSLDWGAASVLDTRVQYGGLTAFGGGLSSEGSGSSFKFASRPGRNLDELSVTKSPGWGFTRELIYSFQRLFSYPILRLQKHFRQEDKGWNGDGRKEITRSSTGESGAKYFKVCELNSFLLPSTTQKKSDSERVGASSEGLPQNELSPLARIFFPCSWDSLG